MLYSTINGQAHNNSTTCCTTNLSHRNARAQRIFSCSSESHLQMSRGNSHEVRNTCDRMNCGV